MTWDIDKYRRRMAVAVGFGLFFIIVGAIPAFAASISYFRQPEYFWSHVYPSGLRAEGVGLFELLGFLLSFIIQGLGTVFLLVPIIGGEPYYLWKTMFVAGVISIASYSGILFLVYEDAMVYGHGSVGYLFLILLFIPGILCIVGALRMRASRPDPSPPTEGSNASSDIEKRRKRMAIEVDTGIFLLAIGIMSGVLGSTSLFAGPKYPWEGMLRLSFQDVLYFPSLILALSFQGLGTVFLLKPITMREPYYFWKILVVTGVLSFASFSGFVLVTNVNAAQPWLARFPHWLLLISFLPGITCILGGFRMRSSRPENPTSATG